MELVQPIKNKRHIEKMKKALHGRDLLLFILGVNSGLRISDILKLKVAELRGKNTLSVQEKKTGKKRIIEFNASLKKAIKEVIPATAAADDYVFKSRKGENKPITRVQAYRILNDAAERAGIEANIGTHTLRKTFGYHSHKAGVDLALIQSILNHSSQTETLRYIGIEQDDINNVYKMLNL